MTVRAILPVAFLLFGYGVANSQPGPLREPGNQSPDHQQIRGNDALESIASQLSAIREQTARIEHERTEREANPFWPPVPSNWFLIALTAGTVVAAMKTLGKMERQTKAAEQAANAALKSAEVAEFVMRSAERGYLVPTDWKFGALEVGKDISISFIVRNVGRSPCKLRRIRIFSMYSFTQPTSLAFNDVFVGQYLIAAGQGMGKPVETGPHLTQPIIEVVKAGGYWLVIEIKYTTEGIADERTHRMCMKYDPKQSKLVMAPSEHDYSD